MTKYKKGIPYKFENLKQAQAFVTENGYIKVKGTEGRRYDHKDDEMKGAVLSVKRRGTPHKYYEVLLVTYKSHF